MPRHSPQSSGRFQGTTKFLDPPERPACVHCGKPMRVETHSPPRRLVGLPGDYDIVVPYYRCGQLGCPGTREVLVVPENPFAPPYSSFDYEVIAKACELRWRHHRTMQEIAGDLAEHFGITVSLGTVGDWLKLYEIGCEARYRPEAVEKMQANGGVIIAVDCMKPLKGSRGLTTARDALTGQFLGSRKLPSEDHVAIGHFLEGVQADIAVLGIPVLGIISDALPAQRIAIEAVFPGVPHCLCHFHFFALVLKAPKELDSHLCTGLRAALRKLPELKRYRAGGAGGTPYVPPGTVAAGVLEALGALANWSRRPKDPCFAGLELFERVQDVLGVLQAAAGKLDAGAVAMAEERVVRRLCARVEAIATRQAAAAAELARVRGHLARLAAILDDCEAAPDEGLRQLRRLRDQLRKDRLAPGRGEAERTFAEELMKFVRTKGVLLFNYRRVSGAPRTNNDLELCYKQLKHFLRRVIGQAAANAYLLAHGERMVFVNPAENFNGILAILQAVDQPAARKMIAQGRRSRDRMSLVMHNPEKWEEKINKIYQILEGLEYRITTVS